MNCLRKNFPLVVLLVAFLLSISTQLTPVWAAYSSLSLSPSDGKIYSDFTKIDIVVDSGTDEFSSIDLYLDFTGEVEFISGTGAERCSSFVVTEDIESINIECFSLDHAEGETYSGVLATLQFKAIGEGTSEFTFGVVDPIVSTRSGGEYTLSAEANPAAAGETEEEDLPDAGIFDDSRGIIIAGTGLILLGIFLNGILDNTSSLFLSLGKKAREERVNKRRGKLEKKF